MTIALTKPKTKFRLGDVIVAYNPQTGWQIPKPQKRGWGFNWLSPEECEQLAPNDPIWVYRDLLNPNGRVYIYAVVKVEAICGCVEDGDLAVRYGGKFSDLITIAGDKKETNFARLTDENAALTFLEQHPLAMNAGNVR